MYFMPATLAWLRLPSDRRHIAYANWKLFIGQLMNVLTTFEEFDRLDATGDRQLDSSE